MNCSQLIVNMHVIMAAKTIKNTDRNALFSSVTGATELLGFSDNSFKTA